LGKIKSLDMFHRDNFPQEFADGEAMGAGWEPGGDREKGGYPIGFYDWELARRNAWFAGFNRGYAWRLRHAAGR
jgi:hypothetical protein